MLVYFIAVVTYILINQETQWLTWVKNYESLIQHFTFSCHGDKSEWGKNVLSNYLQWDSN